MTVWKAVWYTSDQYKDVNKPLAHALCNEFTFKFDVMYLFLYREPQTARSKKGGAGKLVNK